MTYDEITTHFRVWILLSLLAIFTILLSDRFEVASKLDRIMANCTPNIIDLGDLKDLEIENVESEEAK